MRWGLLVSLALVAPAARAGDPSDEARTEYVRGAALVKDAKWSEALAAFERSAALKSHPQTTYSIGACERALGHLTRARGALRAALAANDSGGGTILKPEVVAEAKAMLTEVDARLVRLTMRVSPDGALLAVDGRPLELVAGVAIAGTRKVGDGEPAPVSPFALELDPGVHVFTLSRAGLGDTSSTHTFNPGHKGELTITHEPPKGGAVTIASTSSLALASIDGGAWHPTPFVVQVSPGPHEVAVRIPGGPMVRERVEVAPSSATTVLLPKVPASGTLSVSSNAPARYTLDTLFVGQLPLTVTGVGGAPFKLDVAKPGYRPWSGVVTVPPGKSVAIDVRLAKESERRVDTLFYVGAGVTFALAAGAVTTGLLAFDAKRTFNNYVEEGRTRDDADAARVANRGEVLVSITNVLWAGAALTGVASLGWLAFGGEPAPSTMKMSDR